MYTKCLGMLHFPWAILGHNTHNMFNKIMEDHDQNLIFEFNLLAMDNIIHECISIYSDRIQYAIATSIHSNSQRSYEFLSS